jgi:putative ABC transport system substrate-binding protein
MLMAFSETDPAAQRYLTHFRSGLRELGWIEADNIEIAYRWAGPDIETMSRFAQELVALKPDVIVSSSTPTTAALREHTRTIPVIFAVVVDPIGSGFVATLARPGGNFTGFTNLDPKMTGKWLEFLKEIAPQTVKAVFPFNPETEPYSELYLSAARAAAPTFDIEVVPEAVHRTDDLDALIVATLREQPHAALIPMPGVFSFGRASEITALAARRRIPAVYFSRTFVEAGGLLSYGNDNNDNYRRAAMYVDRILKGARASELPVEFPVKFELLIHAGAARALGIAVPPSLLARADEVIE